jgi:hypothetical protein
MRARAGSDRDARFAGVWRGVAYKGGMRGPVSGLPRVLAPSLAIFVTVLLTTGAWAMDTFLPGAVLGAALCLGLLAPVLWSLGRNAGTSAEGGDRFTAASHELRTPIAGLRAKIEVALADPDGTDPLGTLRDALADVERLHHIVEDRETQQGQDDCAVP